MAMRSRDPRRTVREDSGVTQEKPGATEPERLKTDSLANGSPREDQPYGTRWDIPQVGVDVVEVERLRMQMERTPVFAERIFTSSERAYCERRNRGRMAHYAARFAAKEAVFKAFGTGWRGELRWTDVEVVPDALGAPRLRLRGAARRIAEGAGVTGASLSLSHSRDIAVAFVLLTVEAAPSLRAVARGAGT